MDIFDLVLKLSFLMTGPVRQRLLVTFALACLAAACTSETAWAQAASPRTVPTVHGNSEDFRQPGGWELYRPYIIGVSLLVMVQSAFIAALLIQRTRRVRVERALRESEERFRLMAESEDALRESQQRYALATAAGAVGVWDWNFEANDVYVDPTLKSILGFEHAGIAIRAEDWGSRIHLEDVPMVTARTQACIEGRIDEYEVEHRMIHTDGSVRWFLSRGSLLKHADGTPHRMVGTKVDITERKRAEAAIREKEAVLRASDQEIRNLVGRLIAAQEVERSRIARDLHDDTSQQLAGLAIALSGLKRQVGDLPGVEHLEEIVSSLQQRTTTLAETVRHLSHDLHPSVLDHAGLVVALNTFCTEIQGQHPVTVTFSSEGDFMSIDPEAALCLYRIAQEALRNVVAHAGARHADVRLLRTGGSAELTIADDGKGFDIARTRESSKGLGLVSIGERVRLAGGTVSITTESSQGTRMRVQIPAAQPAPTADGESALYTASA